jgi:hypothetical protein
MSKLLLWFLGGTAFAATTPGWLDRVPPVITPSEKKTYFALPTQEREDFEEKFWADKAITSEEYYRRLNHIDAVFGSNRAPGQIPIPAAYTSRLGLQSGCPMCQAWKPGEWRRNRSAIRKVDANRIIGHGQSPGGCFPKFSLRNTHAMPSTTRSPFPRPASLCVESRVGSSRGSLQAAPGQARTWHPILLVQHECAVVRPDPRNRKDDMVQTEEPSATYSVYIVSTEVRSSLPGAAPLDGLQNLCALETDFSPKMNSQRRTSASLSRLRRHGP